MAEINPAVIINAIELDFTSASTDVKKLELVRGKFKHLQVTRGKERFRNQIPEEKMVCVEVHLSVDMCVALIEKFIVKQETPFEYAVAMALLQGLAAPKPND
ncbi:hypothetical protein [Anaeroselena agilis]|uniref:Uncharacterized protein n=1 Tax=Anaeroselena agilis TaxID=3063788 RepID=A0ABU3P423_9FIRM|nr:hypothetical protein [Selenomonadales bacterium 4137-cl]